MEDVVPGSPSSFSSESTDSDGVNTSSAKVYFGQFQPSEQKLAALVNSTSILQPTTLNASTPGPSSICRSPRLSSELPRRDDESAAIEETDQEGDEDDEDDNGLVDNRTGEIHTGSWQDTPFLEFLRKDEPSSAIASRIMRAHDNPSPPPKAIRSSLTPRASSRLESRLVFPHIPSSEESSDAAVESLLQPSKEHRDSPTPPLIMPDVTPLTTPTIQGQTPHSPVPRDSSNPSVSPAVQANVEGDLISFDRSVLVSPPNQGVKLYSPSAQHPQYLTIDDLLFSSPPQASTTDQEAQIATWENDHGDSAPCELGRATQESDGSSPSAQLSENEVECTQVKDSLQKLESPSQFPDRENGQCKVHEHENQMTPVARLPIPEASPALRRSPRLSCLPLSAPQAAPRPFTPARTPKARTPNLDGSQTRKRRRSGSEKGSRRSLTPKSRDWAMETDESGNETDVFQSPSRKGRRDRKRANKGAEGSSEEVDTRLAESLSPGSALILSTVVPSGEKDTSAPQADIEMADPSTPRRPASLTDGSETNSPVKASVPPPSSNIQRPPPGIFTPYTATPGPSSSTRHLLAPNSPVKLTLTAAPCNDPNRTPARRVPIKDANNMLVASHVSLGQPNGSLVLSGPSRPPVFSRPPLPIHDPDRSPAKRIPVTGSSPKKSVECFVNNAFPGTPSDAGRSRRIDAEPPESGSKSGENKAALITDATNTSSTKCSLPPKCTSSVPGKASTVANASKLAPRVGSRIPRPGGTSKSTSNLKSKLPMPSARKPSIPASTSSRLPPPAKAPLSRVARLDSSSSSSPDGSPADQARCSGTAVSSRKALNNTLVKRKRDTEKSARPMIRMRQVVRGMYGGPTKPVALNGIGKTPIPEGQLTESSVKPAVQQRPIRAREVVKGTLRDFELRTPASKSLEALSEQRAREREELERAKKDAQIESSLPAPSLETFTFECTVPEHQEEEMDTESTCAMVPSDSLPPSDDAIRGGTPSKPSQPQQNGPGARRSSRTRRAPSTDVFGTVSSTNLPVQSNSRRKTGTSQCKPKASSLPPNLLFSTNGLALKTLTNNNTNRNQNYLSQLEMHIVRKTGKRPESPTMKLRTIVEKQKEDQDKMRAERARRRRGEEHDVSGDIETEGYGEMPPMKHRRGPGDEDDYETPVRPNDGRKAVKWDRGLEVSVCLDDIEVQPRKHCSVEGVSEPRKGCLVNAPNQRAPLDDLGNPVNADAPLDLVPEKVVVTKFIYDNDEEALLFDPPAPKTTRSKSKKK